MTEIGTLQALVAELTLTINNNSSSTLHGPSPATAYAKVAASPPHSQPSNLRTITSIRSAGSRWTDTPCCTIDTSRAREESPDETGPRLIRQAIERVMRTREAHANWSCASVIRDAKSAKSIKIARGDERELGWVNQSEQRAPSFECQILLDRLFPVSVDNTNGTAVLDL